MLLKMGFLNLLHFSLFKFSPCLRKHNINTICLGQQKHKLQAIITMEPEITVLLVVKVQNFAIIGTSSSRIS